MNRTKKIAKTLTSLQERYVKTKMSKDDSHFTIDVMTKGKDGKTGTKDDKSVRKNKIKVKGIIHHIQQHTNIKQKHLNMELIKQPNNIKKILLAKKLRLMKLI